MDVDLEDVEDYLYDLGGLTLHVTARHCAENDTDFEVNGDMCYDLQQIPFVEDYIEESLGLDFVGDIHGATCVCTTDNCNSGEIEDIDSDFEFDWGDGDPYEGPEWSGGSEYDLSSVASP